MFETYRTLGCEELESQFSVQRDRSGIVAIADDRHHLPPWASLAAFDQRLKQGETDAAPA